MKKNYIALSIGTVLIVSMISQANSGGSIAGRSGSEASNSATCASSSCHSGPSAGANHSVSIQSNIPASGYVPGATYQIDIVVDDLNDMASLVGFTASVEDGNGNHMGSLAGSSNSSLTFGNPNFVTHSFSATTLPSMGRSFRFDWTAPSTATAPSSVKIYTAVNFCNGNGNTSGDIVQLANETIAKGSGVGLEETEIAFSAYPNPTREKLNLKHAADLIGGHYRLYDMSGKLVFEEKIVDSEGHLDLSSLNRATYILSIEKEGRRAHKEMIQKED